MPWLEYIPEEIQNRYELHNFNHAAEILATAYPEEFNQIINSLQHFHMTLEHIREPGGNESRIPRIFSDLLRPLSWYETKIQGNLIIRKTIFGIENHTQISQIDNFIDGHKIDYVKNKVAFDLEWNSKDQTFDRDLYAFRAFHECKIIDAAVLVTRSAELNIVFESLGTTIKRKYGASTTWMGKLLYRMNAGRHGGCPVLVVGITPRNIDDWTDDTNG